MPKVIAEYRPGRIVSLLDPQMAFPDTGPNYVDKHLRVHVHDITEDVEGWIAPEAGHIETLLKFIGDWDETGPMLVHCYAGISRSTATAFIAACMHNPDVDEVVIAKALRAASPTAQPNRRIVQLADLALGRRGHMLYAAESIGRGASFYETGEAEPFALPSYFAPQQTPPPKKK